MNSRRRNVRRNRPTTSGRKAHRQHVVRWRQLIGAALLSDKRQITRMHVGIADQYTNGL